MPDARTNALSLLDAAIAGFRGRIGPASMSDVAAALAYTRAALASGDTPDIEPGEDTQHNGYDRKLEPQLADPEPAPAEPAVEQPADPEPAVE